MGRGKPKKIRRKLAESEPTLSGKIAIAAFGDLAEYKEMSLIFTLLAYRTFGGSGIAVPFTKVGDELMKLFNDAVRNLDTGFFERCIEVVKWVREREQPPDPRGTAIFEAVRYLARNNPENCNISSTKVAARIFASSNCELQIEPEDVRKIWAAMGMGRFPISIAKIRSQLLAEKDTANVPKMFAIFRGIFLNDIEGGPPPIIVPKRSDIPNQEVWIKGVGNVGCKSGVPFVPPKSMSLRRKKGE